MLRGSQEEEGSHHNEGDGNGNGNGKKIAKKKARDTRNEVDQENIEDGNIIENEGGNGTYLNSDNDDQVEADNMDNDDDDNWKGATFPVVIIIIVHIVRLKLALVTKKEEFKLYASVQMAHLPLSCTYFMGYFIKYV
jgi:hypothetical protein